MLMACAVRVSLSSLTFLSREGMPEGIAMPPTIVALNAQLQTKVRTPNRKVEGPVGGLGGGPNGPGAPMFYRNWSGDSGQQPPNGFRRRATHTTSRRRSRTLPTHSCREYP